MCVNYTPTRRDQISAKFSALDQTGEEWRPEAWQDYQAPFITHDELRRRRAQLGAYSMIPKNKLAPGVKRFSTMNARAETIGELTSYAKAWRSAQLCLIPMQDFFEPNYESGKPERWQIGVINDQERTDFAVAGLYRTWEEADGQTSFSFTQITINADQHPLMSRFHQPDDEKRSLVILPEEDYDEWLACRNPEIARAFLQLYPAHKMWAQSAILPSRKQVKAKLNEDDGATIIAMPQQASLFSDH